MRVPMSSRFPIRAFALAAVVALAGCNQEPAADAATAEPAAQAPATDDAALMAAAEAAAKAANDPSAAVQPDAGATPEPAAPDAAVQPSAASSGIPGLVKGTDYDVINGGQPFEPLNGKIEVVEVFNYVCPACARFEPMLQPWKQSLPADVRFTYVPAAFGGNWDQYVRAFYTAQTMGIGGKAHDALYEAIHVSGKLKGERGEDSDEDLAKFFAAHGADPKQFASGMRSFAVTAKYNQARQFIMTNGVNSTPTLVVNGRYKPKGRSFEDMIRIADILVAHERQQAAARGAKLPAASAPAPAPAPAAGMR